jgi:hypothetical protein
MLILAQADKRKEKSDKRKEKSDKNMVWKTKLENSKNKYQKNDLEKTVSEIDFRFFRKIRFESSIG